MKQHTTPCKSCPFRKDIKPGALGGSPPQTFIGQSVLPFWLPCHSAYDPAVSAKDQDPRACAQCAGAAIYRTNVGAAPFMPPHILTLPADDKVFTAHETFLAHHARVSTKEAAEQLRRTPVTTLALHELQKQEIKVRAIPRDAPLLEDARSHYDRQHATRGHTSAPED